MRGALASAPCRCMTRTSPPSSSSSSSVHLEHLLAASWRSSPSATWFGPEGTPAPTIAGGIGFGTQECRAMGVRAKNGCGGCLSCAPHSRRKNGTFSKTSRTLERPSSLIPWAPEGLEHTSANHAGAQKSPLQEIARVVCFCSSSGPGLRLWRHGPEQVDVNRRQKRGARGGSVGDEGERENLRVGRSPWHSQRKTKKQKTYSCSMPLCTESLSFPGHNVPRPQICEPPPAR